VGGNNALPLTMNQTMTLRARKMAKVGSQVVKGGTNNLCNTVYILIYALFVNIVGFP